MAFMVSDAVHTVFVLLPFSNFVSHLFIDVVKSIKALVEHAHVTVATIVSLHRSARDAHTDDVVFSLRDRQLRARRMH